MCAQKGGRRVRRLKPGHGACQQADAAAQRGARQGEEEDGDRREVRKGGHLAKGPGIARRAGHNLMYAWRADTDMVRLPARKRQDAKPRAARYENEGKPVPCANCKGRFVQAPDNKRVPGRRLECRGDTIAPWWYGRMAWSSGQRCAGDTADPTKVKRRQICTKGRRSPPKMRPGPTLRRAWTAGLHDHGQREAWQSPMTAARLRAWRRARPGCPRKSIAPLFKKPRSGTRR